MPPQIHRWFFPQLNKNNTNIWLNVLLSMATKPERKLILIPKIIYLVILLLIIWCFVIYVKFHSLNALLSVGLSLMADGFKNVERGWLQKRNPFRLIRIKWIQSFLMLQNRWRQNCRGVRLFIRFVWCWNFANCTGPCIDWSGCTFIVRYECQH